ncbi:RICIN domain-containing protein [Nonomuraea lactucae]|uniref:RICIN domain-containing protein n=1 Tax=Nonomuraea lactucae TaxID=2249762 RepID=UPI000DE55011|nr:ricin-type beta-trefoil lectin domain protein [Nonomuraea lactucae]
MRSWKRGTARVAMVVGLVTAGAVTVPGTAHAGTVWEIWNNYNGLFLDSDPNGNVYALSRQNNKNQKWVERANGLRSNVKTGRCLIESRNTRRDYRTVPCDSRDRNQRWTHVKHRGGVLIKNVGSGWCAGASNTIDVGNAQVLTPLICDPHDKMQLWSVRAI